MDCFICSHQSEASGFVIASEFTKYTNQSVETAIKRMVGDTFKVTIKDYDIICLTCLTIINELDRLIYEARLFERILTRQMKRRLGMHENQLLDIDGIALLSFRINENQMHSCKKCKKVVRYLDEMTAHYKYHQLTDVLSTQQHISTEEPSECASINNALFKRENFNPQFAPLPQMPKLDFISPHYQNPAETLPENHLRSHTSQNNQPITAPHLNSVNMTNIQSENVFSSQKYESPSTNLSDPFLNKNALTETEGANASDDSSTTSFNPFDIYDDEIIVNFQDNFESTNGPDNHFNDDPIEAELNELLLQSDVRELSSIAKITEISQLYYRCKLCPFVGYRHTKLYTTQNCLKCNFQFTQQEFAIMHHCYLDHGPSISSVAAMVHVDSFICEICDSRFEQKSQIRKHFQKAHLRHRECETTFTTSLEQSQHVATQHKMQQAECKRCKMVFQSIVQRNVHEMEKRCKFVCRICNVYFATAHECGEHFRNNHHCNKNQSVNQILTLQKPFPLSGLAVPGIWTSKNSFTENNLNQDNGSF